MFASLLRPKRQRGQIEQSPFSPPSPWFRAHNSRRVPRADESSDDAPELREIDEEDIDQDWEEEEEDGPLESTPLLPMFSASHLGTQRSLGYNVAVSQLTNMIRCATRLQHHPRHPSLDRLPLRNHPNMGPITLAAGLPIPDQADPAKDHVGPLFARDPLCTDGQLSPIRERNTPKPGE